MPATKDPVETANQTPAPKTAKKPRGEGLTITIDFKDHLELLDEIRRVAKEDDREPSKWLRRRLVQLEMSGDLFLEDPEPVDTDDITG